MKNFRIEIKWALIFFAIGLAWMYFEKLMGWHGPKIDQHATNTMYFFPIAIAVYVFALLDKRKSLGGTMSWKQGFISGLIIGGLVALLSPLSQYIVHNVISPEYFPNVIAYGVESGQTTLEAAEAMFNMKQYIMMSAVGALISGAVTAAVVAIFVKRG